MRDEERTPALTGGCQCGAVRYALYSVPTEPSICHCRMCLPKEMTERGYQGNS